MTGLSVVACRVQPMWHPWRALAHRTDITVRWYATPGRLGSWCERTRTLTLHPGQGQAERRCTLTHELVHAELGHRGPCTGSVERRVSAEAARRLIGDEELVEALLWSRDEQELSEELWVDVATVRTRLADLSDAEKADIDGRLWAREEAA